MLEHSLHLLNHLHLWPFRHTSSWLFVNQLLQQFTVLLLHFIQLSKFLFWFATHWSCSCVCVVAARVVCLLVCEQLAMLLLINYNNLVVALRCTWWLNISVLVLVLLMIDQLFLFNRTDWQDLLMVPGPWILLLLFKCHKCNMLVVKRGSLRFFSNWLTTCRWLVSISSLCSVTFAIVIEMTYLGSAVLTVSLYLRR